MVECLNRLSCSSSAISMLRLLKEIGVVHQMKVMCVSRVPAFIFYGFCSGCLFACNNQNFNRHGNPRHTNMNHTCTDAINISVEMVSQNEFASQAKAKISLISSAEKNIKNYELETGTSRRS